MALYSLAGLSALEPPLVVKALKSEDVKGREHALRLAETYADRAEVHRDACRTLHRDTDEPRRADGDRRPDTELRRTILPLSTNHSSSLPVPASPGHHLPR